MGIDGTNKYHFFGNSLIFWVLGSLAWLDASWYHTIMNVSDFMNKAPVSVQEDESVRHLIKLIFSKGVSGIPVLKGKKVVGIVTEEDILQRVFPTIKEVMEDFIHAGSEEMVNDHLSEMMNKPVTSIMTKPVVTIKEHTPLMKALTLIILNKFSHVPVVNEHKELVGIVSQGDIFKVLTKQYK